MWKLFVNVSLSTRGDSPVHYVRAVTQAQAYPLPHLPLFPDSGETLALETNHLQLYPPLSYFMKNWKTLLS